MSTYLQSLARVIRDFRRYNVIHRDLATEHIFVRGNFELSVIDFGMSSFLHQLSPEKYQAALFESGGDLRGA
jgi:tRNA A-37 threonylcarbamoyl transferase component Bud32